MPFRLQPQPSETGKLIGLREKALQIGRLNRAWGNSAALNLASEAPLNARGLFFLGGTHADICIRFICGVDDAGHGSFHSRGYDG